MSIKVMTLVWERSRFADNELLAMLAMADHAHDNGTGIRIGRKRLRRKMRTKSKTTTKAVVARLLASNELVLTHKGGNGPGDVDHYRIDVKLLMTQPYMLADDEDDDEKGSEFDRLMARAKGPESDPITALRGQIDTAKGSAAGDPKPSVLETNGEREDEAARAPALAASKNWTEAAFDVMAARASRSEWERKIADDRKISDESWRDAMLAFTRAFPDARYDRDLWVGQRGANIEKFLRAWGGKDDLLAKAVELMRGRAAQDPMFAARHPAMLVPYLDAARLQPVPSVDEIPDGIIADIASRAPSRAPRATKTAKRVFSPDEITMLQMNPLVGIHREVFGNVLITYEQMEDIAERAPRDPALWKRCCEEWLRARWRADNVMGLVSMAIVEEKRAGLPAGGHTAQRGRTFRHPQIPDPTDAERAASEERAAKQLAQRAIDEQIKADADAAREALEAERIAAFNTPEARASQAAAERQQKIDAATARMSEAEANLVQAEKSLAYIESRGEGEFAMGMSARRLVERFKTKCAEAQRELQEVSNV